VADVAAVPHRDVVLVRGATSRQKVIMVTGLSGDRAAALFLGG